MAFPKMQTLCAPWYGWHPFICLKSLRISLSLYPTPPSLFLPKIIYGLFLSAQVVPEQLKHQWKLVFQRLLHLSFLIRLVFFFSKCVRIGTCCRTFHSHAKSTLLPLQFFFSNKAVDLRVGPKGKLKNTLPWLTCFFNCLTTFCLQLAPKFYDITGLMLGKLIKNVWALLSPFCMWINYTQPNP